MSRPLTTKPSSRTRSPGTDENVLGSSLRVRGRVNGEGDLRIEGSVEGDITVTGLLSVDSGGTVTGNTQAQAVSIDGTLTGDVEAQGEVSIRKGARVVGNMNGAQISLEEGAAFSGRIDADFELPDGLDSTKKAPATRGRK